MTRRSGTNRLPRSGFTLIELVVVLAILGITLAAVAPAFILTRAKDRDDAVAGISLILDRARTTAVTTARETSVSIDPSFPRVWIRTSGVPPALDTTFTPLLPRGTELSAQNPRPTFLFRPDGSASGNGLIVSSPGRRSIVTVDQWTGDVRVLSIGTDSRPNAKP